VSTIPDAVFAQTLFGFLAPVAPYLRDDRVSEIMINGFEEVYVEKGGRLERTDARFASDHALESAVRNIAQFVGKTVSAEHPVLDARLPDGSRVCAILPPAARRGICVSIRRFPKERLTVDQLLKYGAITETARHFLELCVFLKRNIMVAGGTGSGKTSLLNALSSFVPKQERIVVIEDSSEVQLQQPHAVYLEARPPDAKGRGAVTIRDLLRATLRMRPDRIVVGECRGGEALDMLQAMNTGHDGSLTTTHANSPDEAIARLETLVLMGGVELPTRAIREQIANSIHLVVQQQRFVDGSRKITSIAEVIGMDEDGIVHLEPIFEFFRTPGERGKVTGEYRATGFMPSFINEFITMGLVTDGEYL